MAKTAAANPPSTEKLIVDGALSNAAAKVRKQLHGSSEAFVGRASTARQLETQGLLREVAEGRHPELREALVGSAASRMPTPPGSGIVREDALSSEARGEISNLIRSRLAAVTSNAYPGRDLLSLLGERFAMTVDDLALLIKRARLKEATAPAAERRGQVSNVGGHSFEGRFLAENTPELWSRERDAAQQTIRELLGAPAFTFEAGQMAHLPMPPEVRAMFEVLEDAGLFKTSVPGIWVKRVPGAADAAGELTDGLTMVVDLRDQAKVDVHVVGLREAKFKTVVNKLREQVLKDFQRLLEGVVIQGRSIEAAQVTVSKHLVVSLLTDKRKVSDQGMKEIRTAFSERFKAEMKPVVEIDGTDDAALAREIAANTLEIGGGKYTDLLKKAPVKP